MLVYRVKPHREGREGKLYREGREGHKGRPSKNKIKSSTAALKLPFEKYSFASFASFAVKLFRLLG
jgi:hypothetical protein